MSEFMWKTSGCGGAFMKVMTSASKPGRVSVYVADFMTKAEVDALIDALRGASERAFGADAEADTERAP